MARRRGGRPLASAGRTMSSRKWWIMCLTSSSSARAFKMLTTRRQISSRFRWVSIASMAARALLTWILR
eukprot:4249883-Alexandrium_andersonii.AAC.1